MFPCMQAALAAWLGAVVCLHLDDPAADVSDNAQPQPRDNIMHT